MFIDGKTFKLQRELYNSLGEISQNTRSKIKERCYIHNKERCYIHNTDTIKNAHHSDLPL